MADAPVIDPGAPTPDQRLDQYLQSQGIVAADPVAQIILEHRRVRRQLAMIRETRADPLPKVRDEDLEGFV